MELALLASGYMIRCLTEIKCSAISVFPWSQQQSKGVISMVQEPRLLTSQAAAVVQHSTASF